MVVLTVAMEAVDMAEVVMEEDTVAVAVMEVAMVVVMAVEMVMEEAMVGMTVVMVGMEGTVMVGTVTAVVVVVATAVAKLCYYDSHPNRFVLRPGMLLLLILQVF